MKTVYAPDKVDGTKIENYGKILFLAGSINMGKSINWQERVIKELKDTDWTILNPRRKDWDNSWKQEKTNKQFKEQVDWELDGLELATRILLYFEPLTSSPVSLLELGLFGPTHKMLVVCPPGFWRKGNVDIVCDRYNIHQCNTLDIAISTLKILDD